MSYDVNGDARQSAGFDPLPAGTSVPVTMSIRPGGAGDDSWLKQQETYEQLQLGGCLCCTHRDF